MTIKIPDPLVWGWKPSRTLPWLGRTNEPGLWAQLSVCNNELVAKECTDSEIPFGILIDTVYINDRLMAQIDVTIGSIWETDVIDHSQLYPVNAMLFIKDGRLTTQDSNQHLSVGMVVRPPINNNTTIEFLRTK
jgi:hypothetical protein